MKHKKLFPFSCRSPMLAQESSFICGSRTGSFRLPKGFKEIFQPVNLYFIDRLQHPAQLAFRKILVRKPNHIRLRQVNQQTPLIFTKRHPHRCQSQKLSCIWQRIIRTILVSLVYSHCTSLEEPSRISPPIHIFIHLSVSTYNA